MNIYFLRVVGYTDIIKLAENDISRHIWSGQSDFARLNIETRMNGNF